jgi:V/A-type H+-transporting ATPase subunit I
MPWREALRPARMQRVALLAPQDALRSLLVSVADEGAVALEELPADEPVRTVTPAAARLQKLQAEHAAAPMLAPSAPDLDRCEAEGRLDLIAGEARLEERSAQAVTRGSVAALVGWTPADKLPGLAERVAGDGGAVVPLPSPTGVQPPTLLAERGAAGEFAPLVDTYATVPYADLNPALIAGVAYVVMFGMMFADLGHGALVLFAAIAIRLQWWSRLQRLRRVWLFLAGAGMASMVFGTLYGEFFGPTHVIPVIWLNPLDHPVLLLGAAVGVGAVLLAGAYALGTVNRFREGGWRVAAYAPSGLAGVALFLGLAAIAAGVYFDQVWLAVLGAALTVGGLVVAFIGMFAAAGGGASGVAQASVELLDLVVRLGSNLVSFARLAAFGMVHAALGQVVWEGSVGAWRQGPFAAIGAVVLFAVGNAITFALEGLIAAIQALRLEYYELFSRIFDIEGQPFRPWHIPLDPAYTTESPC